MRFARVRQLISMALQEDSIAAHIDHLVYDLYEPTAGQQSLVAGR